MAQIIKQRRGSVSQVNSITSVKGELIMSTGSVGTMNGPFIYVGTADGQQGAYSAVSKIYQGTSAPSLTSYGTTLDGTPFYDSSNKSLNILYYAGNQEIDLTGNIEGNTISGVTINNLQSTNVTASFVSASFVGDATGLYNIPATGVTGLNLSKIYSGSVQVSTDSVSGTVTISGGTVNIENDTYINNSTLYANDINGNAINGGYVNIYSENYSQLNYNNQNYVWVDSDGAFVETNTGNINIRSYNSGQLYLNTDGSEGNVTIGNNTNDLYLNTSTIHINNTFNMYHDGAMFLDDIDSTGIEIQSANYTKLKQNDNSGYFYTSQNYAEMYGNTGIDVYTNSGNLWVYNNSGNVNISSYDGSTLELNTDGGEGNINLGNNNNDINGYTTITNFQASNYAQLESNNSYVWVDADAAYVENNNNGVAGFTARPNSVAEITGSLTIDGNTQINGNTSVTGALVVSNGSATFDQGLVAQNSNMLLTSGSNLIIQDGGNLGVAGNVYITGSETVDYIQGYTQQWNYLALNGGPIGAPDVELGSIGNISLWAEGGYVNVTGSLNVTGDIVFSGSINIGDNLGQDTINFQGEVSSSILPKVDNAFDLGSDTQRWSNIWGNTAHFNNISLDTISFSGLTEGRVLLAGPTGSIVDSGSLTFDNGYLNLSGSIKLNTDAYIYNDNELYIEDHTYGVIVQSNNYAELRSSNAWVWVEGNNAYVEGNSYTQIYTDSGNVDISAYDGGTLNLNSTGGEGDIHIGVSNLSNSTFINSYNTFITGANSTYMGMNGDTAHFKTTDNYAEMYGGTGLDVYTNSGNLWVYNNSGNVNISSYDGGTLNLNTDNGEGDVYMLNGGNELHVDGNTSITGSMTVSNGLAFINQGVIASNSDLTLEGGSNQHMNDGAHLYFDTCVDIYWDNGNGDLIFYNDCNAFQFRNSVSVTGSLNVDGNVYLNNNNTLYTNNIYGYDGGDLYIQTDNSTLYLNQNYQTYIDSNNYTSIGYNNEQNYTYYENGGVYTYSNDGYIELKTPNNDGGENYIYVERNGVALQTYDNASNDNHQVYLYDNGNLVLSNVNFNILPSSTSGFTYGNVQVGNNLSVTGSITAGDLSVDNLHVSESAFITGALHVSGNTYLNQDLIVSGNLTILGTGSVVNISSSIVDIGTNIVTVNTYAPFLRYGGLAVYDSGSMGKSGSVIFDSLNDYWMFVNASGKTSQAIGTTYGTYGSEISLSTNMIPVATGTNTLGDSLLSDDGTVFTYNTNKFSVTGSTGDTYIGGNLTIGGLGGVDNGEETSHVTFINSDNVLGFIDSTDTMNVMTQLLGYDSTTGNLEFSSVIDGGGF